MRRLALLLLLLAQAGLAQPVRPMVGEDSTHKVAPGENLYTLGQQYSLAIEHLAFANRLPTTSMYVPVGTKLVIPTRRVLPDSPPANGLVVNLPERGVFLFKNGAFEKFFPVAIGQPGRFHTPQGSFTLVSRVTNPTWLPPEWAGVKEKLVPAGPNNPLGDRWMGLSLSGVGLHATTSPLSIGQAASHGCMRMYPSSAHELFDLVEVGMPVRIEYEPVKVGRDESTGAVCLVVYPDVYGQVGSLKAEAQRVLERAGIAGLVDDATLDRLVAAASGTPEKLVGADVAVTVDDRAFEQAAVLAAGSLWINSEVARALGMELSYDGGSRTLTVRHGGEEASYMLGDDMILLAGKALVKARTLLDRFNIGYRWEAETRTLKIGSGS